MQGWLKLHRQLLDHWISSEPESLAVWVRLLMEANHKTSKRKFNGTLTEIKRGQLIFGLNAFSEKSGVSVAKLRRIMNELEQDGMISRQKTNKFSLITIAYFERYQEDDRQKAGKKQASDNQTTIETQADNNQIATPKECKNDKECEEGNKNAKSRSSKLDYSSWPSMPSEQVMNDWLALRKRLKANVSQTVINRFAKEFHEAAKYGFTVEHCLTECVAKGWRGFEADWITKNLQRSQGQQVQQMSNAAEQTFRNLEDGF